MSAPPSPLGVIPQYLWEERVKTERIDSLLAAAERAGVHYRQLRALNPRDTAREESALLAIANFASEAAGLTKTLGEKKPLPFGSKST